MGGLLDRWPRNTTLVRLLAPLPLILALCAPAHAAAPIALGEVTTKITRPEIDVPATFRAEVARQLQGVQLDLPDQDHVVLSASLVQLDTRRSGDRAESKCEVSATLRKKRGGALVAILRGRARAEDAARASADNELTVMRAAVRSAMRGIPTALKS